MRKSSKDKETRNVELGSSLVPQPVTVESDAQPQNPVVQTDVPITNESQVHNESTESETEIASNGPNLNRPSIST